MTSIVNFEERMKSSGRLSNTILESLERLHDAKLNGALKEDELSKILTLEGKLFANQVSMGLKNEEEVEDFEKEIPNGKYNCFNYPHKDLDVAFGTIKQINTAALFDRENSLKQFQSVKRI